MGGESTNSGTVAVGLPEELGAVAGTTPLRARVDRLERGDPDERERLLELQRTAALEGYPTEICGACGESSHVSLLPEPACPACGTPFYDIVETGVLRAKPTLVGRGEGAE